jgi:long-chain acyl-CoA synthetase
MEVYNMVENNAYEERPWLKAYPTNVPADIEIPAKSVAQLFNEVTERWQNRAAISFYGKQISYKELRDKVDKLSTALHDLGVRKGDRVALLLLNSPEHIIAFYAIVKLGAVVTAISPVYVSSEIRHQLVDSKAETLICQDILFEAFERTGLKLKHVILTNIAESLPRIKRVLGKSILREVYQKMAAPSPDIYKSEGVYEFKELINRYPANPPDVQIDIEEDLVTLPYTGGTTGVPKGVMITHRNIVANITQYHAFFPLFQEGNEVFLGYMPFYHAGGQVLLILDMILYGATVVILTTPDIDEILRVIVRYNLDTLIAAPALFERLADYKKTNRINWKRFKWLTCGSDALHEETFLKWKARTGTEITEGYGQTEVTLTTHSNVIGKARPGWVGIPITGTSAAILNPDKDEFCPVNEIGEIAVQGPQVTKGYYNKSQATRDCEAIINGKRWWRTGDLGRMDKDGFFQIYDRKRDLIKYKGLRVYAREVEEVLVQHADIREVGVIGVSDIKVGQNVKAFVVLEGDARGKVSEKDIMDYCKDKMAPYKIPRIIEFVGEIPKTDVGKVSRRELREEER